MKLRVVFAVLLAIALCVGAYFLYASRLVISGELLEVGDNKRVYLELYDNQQSVRVDSVDIDNRDHFRFVVRRAIAEPMLYTLVVGWERIPLLCGRGERVRVVASGSVASNYSVRGSEESELLRSFYQPFLANSQRLRRIASRYAHAQSVGEDVAEFAKEYTALYRETKQLQMRFVAENKGQMSAFYALMQLLPGDRYLFSRTSDLIYKRSVAEGLAQSYPKSPYRMLLEREIERRERQDSLMRQVSYVDFPELTLPDRYGKRISLSSLKGDVILVDFWSAELGTSNQNNAQLKRLYDQYALDGFKVYQVGIDKSRSAWLAGVQKQRLPWISVSDLKGGNSPALGLYNVTQLPSNVLIGRSGQIVGRHLYGAELEEAVVRELNSNDK